MAKDNRDFRFAISSGNDFRLELERFKKDGNYLGEKPFVAAYETEERKYKMTADFSLVNMRTRHFVFFF